MSYTAPSSTIELAAESGDPTQIGNELLGMAGFDHSRVRSYVALDGGNPVMSQVFRVWISGTENQIPTVIVKIPARQSADRSREAANGSYVREMESYSLLLDMQGGFQPRVYASIHDQNAQTVAMLIEDLGHLPSRNEFELSTVHEVLKNLARIHSRYWSDDRLGRNWWMRNGHRADIFDEDTDLFVPNWEMLISSPELRPCDQPEVNRGAQFLADNLLDVLDELDSRPPTLSHGDLHTANIMFRRSQDGTHPVLIDWQDAVYGGGSSDVAKFLSTTLTPTAAHSHFDELISAYHSALPSGIRSGYSFQAFRREVMLALISTFANYVICATTSCSSDVDPQSLNSSLRRVSSVIDVVRPLDEL